MDKIKVSIGMKSKIKLNYNCWQLSQARVLKCNLQKRGIICIITFKKGLFAIFYIILYAHYSNIWEKKQFLTLN